MSKKPFFDVTWRPISSVQLVLSCLIEVGVFSLIGLGINAVSCFTGDPLATLGCYEVRQLLDLNP